MENTERIYLGYPLDILLNRDCKFSDYKNIIGTCKKPIKNKGEMGGIVLPNDNDPGTGNIIIRGKPGTAKSTLALQ